jgi:hypothetical protein
VEKRVFLYIKRNDASAAYGGDDPYFNYLGELASITKERYFAIFRWPYSLYRISPKP